MKLIGIVMMVLAFVLGGFGARQEILADYEYNNQIGSYWSLSEKASSLTAKADYLDKFVYAVDNAGLSGNNAIFLKTPNNSVEQNLNALHSLQTRMIEIRGMDVTSFAYQQAISQITAQEQGEAKAMLGEIEGSWYLKNHFWLWQWVDLLRWLFLAGVGAAGFVIFVNND